MNSPQDNATTPLREARKHGIDTSWANRLICWLGSVKFAVILLVLLIFVLALATILEGTRGPEFVHWHIYSRPWFDSLFVLLAVNILAATLSRYPWGGRQFGFIITHTALLVLLVGIAQSRLFGTEGRILLEQGVAQDRFVLPQRSEIRVSMPQTAERRCVVCSFAAGPEDWPEEKELELGAIDGIEFVVEQFRRHGANRLSPLAVDALGRGLSESEASIRLEAQVGGVPVSLWLDRNGQNQTTDTARGPLLASFGYSHQQLGFSLELLQLQRTWNPGGVGYSSIVSKVRLVDQESAVDRIAEIAVNKPLTHKGHTFYQLDVHTSPDGKVLSILQVTRHPGRPLIYLGVVLVCLGTLITIIRRSPDMTTPSNGEGREL